MSLEILTVTKELTTLDLLLWRRFKRDVPGLVEKTFAMNPDIVFDNEYLKLGRQIKVETPPPETQGRAATPVISLYD